MVAVQPPKEAALPPKERVRSRTHLDNVRSPTETATYSLVPRITIHFQDLRWPYRKRMPLAFAVSRIQVATVLCSRLTPCFSKTSTKWRAAFSALLNLRGSWANWSWTSFFICLLVWWRISLFFIDCSFLLSWVSDWICFRKSSMMPSRSVLSILTALPAWIYSIFSWYLSSNLSMSRSFSA